MHYRLSDEVAGALEAGRAVVALESTVISHGLPRPKNLETALRLEAIVREGGAVPATIAVLGGEFCVGLDRSQIEFLASSNEIRKISRRDLAIAAAKRLDCATTVATTAFIANSVGIKVFATGGIGGVHRGYSADVSADLVELVRTPVIVVCSGPKIVLDLPATREWLETFGVPVLGWKCDEMPAFYSRSSGLSVDERVDSPEEVTAIARARNELELSNAILVTVPVPPDREIERSEIKTILNASLKDADEKGISGKDITPFLLSELAERSGGKTLKANIRLLENNAAIACEIAVAMANRTVEERW